MRVHEVGEVVAEQAHGARHLASDAAGHEGFRRRAGVYIGIMGALLAVASVGGEYSMKQTINANIYASNTYAFYQARNIRQTSYQIAADDLAAQLAAGPTMPAAARAAMTERLATYKARIARWESDPADGTGKKELLGEAQRYEAERELWHNRDLNFDFARVFYEIAIVLGSVSIVAGSRPLMGLSGGLAATATALSANGFFLLVDPSLLIH